MDFDPLLAEHGLWFAFISTTISGDTGALTAGVLEHRGVLRFWPAVLAVALGGWVSDLGIFLAARLFRANPRVARALDQPGAVWFTERFLSRPVLLAAMFRFVPGSRTFVPAALATGGTIGFRLYAAVTGVTCVIWAWMLIAVGHGIGELIQDIWGRIREVETIMAWPILAAAAVVVTAIWRFLHVRKRNGTR